jgi:acyl-homoserine-lactone acylase
MPSTASTPSLPRSRAARLLLAMFACLLLALQAVAGPVAARSVEPPGPPDTAPGRPDLRAVVRWTPFGVPHVRAGDYAGAGYGLGYAFAEGHACTMADQWVRLAAELSAHFGAGGGNLASDFFWQKMIDDDLVGQLLADTGPTGVMPQVREIVRGYTAGYNRYLAEVGFEIPDPRCEGATWIRPITERDVYHHALHWDILAFLTGEFGALAAAQPPGGAAVAPTAASPALPDSAVAPTLSASNMIALGAEATTSGNGMVFANPHWQWSGPISFFEAHLHIPGELNVSGMTPHGVPVIGIGHNERVGWSHTASTSTRGVRYRLDLAEGSPTTYVVDGEEHEMVPTTVTVQVRNAAGELEPVSHTFYDTSFGPVSVTAARPWTDEHAFTFLHAPLNVAGLNTWLLYGKAETVADIHAASAATLGMSWINVVAADADGGTYYAMPNAIPYVTAAQRADCGVGGGVLDGSRSACNAISDPAAPYDGVFPAHMTPFTFRGDYVQNSNDSHWVTNVRSPIEGIEPAFGLERTTQGQRTRHGLSLVEGRLDGSDGQPGTGFTLDQLVSTTFDGLHFFGRLWQDELVAFCHELDAAGAHPDMAKACEVLADWGATDELDDPGAVLFRRFIQRSGTGAARFSVPFDPDDPVNTPRGLNTSTAVADALVGAINDLLGSGIPLDATLRGLQYRLAAGERIPVPGGPGIYQNLTVSGFQGADGWVALAGSSFVMWVEFTPDGPVGKQILIQSQSSNPASPHFADQTWLFAAKQYKDILFRDQDIAANQVRVAVLRSPPPGCERANPKAPPCPG